MASFEQTISVLHSIRKILTDYPYGNAILLELLQNADDAKAEHVTTILETFTANDSNEAARSPALVFHNSATFTDGDLLNLQNFGTLEETTKRYDATKVGRFGVGFNSSFHVCDVISFVTRDRLIVFDPAKAFLPPGNDGEVKAGLQWNIKTFEQDPKMSDPFKDFARTVLSSFENAGLGFDRQSEQPFQGTIFRLPLRQKPSALWGEIHRPLEIADLLVKFLEMASLGMVMLKHIRSIEAKVHRYDPKSSLEQLFIVKAVHKVPLDVNEWLQAYTNTMDTVKSETKALVSSDDAMREQVAIRANNIQNLPAPKVLTSDIAITMVKSNLYTPFSRVVEEQSDSTDGVFLSAINGLAFVNKNEHEKEHTDQYKVIHQLGPGGGWQDSDVWKVASTHAQHQHIVNVPWGAAIVNVGSDSVDGRLLCYFPIKSGTKLPVHIHGCFKVSSDRQSIKDVSDEWNRSLAKEVIAHAYANAIVAVQDLKMANYYNLFPTLAYTDNLVDLIASQMLQTIVDTKLEVIASSCGWHSADEIQFPFLNADGGSYVPSEDSEAAIHCLLVTASQQRLATFPNFDIQTPPTQEQLLQLKSLSKRLGSFDCVVAAITPASVKELLPSLTQEAAQLLLTSASLAVELFLMCTIGVASNISSAPKYYSQLPCIPLMAGASAFVGSIPPQLVPSNAFVSSPYQANDLGLEGQALVCQTDASLKLANEAFPQRIVQTSFPNQKQFEPYLVDPKIQKLLGIRPIDVYDLKCLFQYSGQPLTWHRGDRPDSWFVKNSAVHLNISAETLNVFLTEEMGDTKSDLSMLAEIPWLPVVDSGTVRISTPICESAHMSTGASKSCFVVIDSADSDLAALLQAEKFGNQIDSSIVRLEVIEAIGKGRLARLDGIGTLSLLEENSQAFSPLCAQHLIAHFIRYFESICEAGDPDLLNKLKSLKLFPSFCKRRKSLCSASTAIRLPSNFALIADSSGATKEQWTSIQDRLSAAGTYTAYPYTILAHDPNIDESRLAELLEVKTMNMADFWTSVRLLPLLSSSAHDSETSTNSPGLAQLTEKKAKNLARRLTSSLSKDPDHGFIFRELILSIAACNEQDNNLLTLLRAEKLFTDAHGSFTPTLAFLQSNESPAGTGALITLLQSVVVRGAAERPRVIILPIENEDSQMKVAHRLGIATAIASNFLVPIARALSQYLKEHSTKTVPISSVTSFLTVIQDCEKAERTIPDTVLKQLAEVQFVPAVSASEYLKLCENDQMDKNITFSAPNDCVESKVFSTFPKGKCLHPLVIPDANRDSFIPVLSLFKWNQVAELDDLFKYSNEACIDCTTRRSKGDSLSTRPVEYHEHFMDHLYSEIERRKPSLLSSDFQMYLPLLDMVGTSRTMSRASEARNLHPLFGMVDSSLQAKYPTILNAMKIRCENSVEEVIEALAKIPMLVSPLAEDITTVSLPDKTRELFRSVIGYLVSILQRKGSDAAMDRSLTSQLLVPTSDGKCNFADKVYYDYFFEAVQEPSHTTLWNRITASDARMLSMKHAGLETLKRLNLLRAQADLGEGLFAAGPRLSLVNGIKRILCDYNDPSAIFLEMIQNADDAGAQKIEFILDERSYPKDGESEGYFGNGMRNQLGPALVVKNDALFQPSDFSALQDIGMGHKESDSNKIGRFGVGFNSVYHITDCPSVVSASTILIFDPTLVNIDIATTSQPGLAIDHVLCPSIGSQFPNQVKPYEASGVKIGATYSGTLFRLPLRSDESSLAQPVGQSKVLEWMNGFVPLLEDILLFLKSLVKIKISRILANESQERLSEVSIENVKEMKAYRSLVSQKTSLHAINSHHSRAVDTISEDCHINLSGKKSLFKVFTHIEDTPHQYQSLVPNSLQNKLCSTVSLAIEMNVRTKLVTERAHGGLRCFFPLPGTTKLPFYAHALFAISSDRKAVWTEGVTHNATTWEHTWNTHLLQETLPRCFINCLSSITKHQPKWHIWPSPHGQTEELARTCVQLAITNRAPVFPTFDEKTLSAADGTASVTDLPLNSGLYEWAGPVKELLSCAGRPLITAPKVFKDMIFNHIGDRELNGERVRGVLVAIVRGRQYIPFSDIMLNVDATKNSLRKAVDTIERLIRYVFDRPNASPYVQYDYADSSLASPPMTGLPFNIISTNELAVIGNSNCYIVANDQTFTTLCPHLDKRNIISPEVSTPSNNALCCLPVMIWKYDGKFNRRHKYRLVRGSSLGEALCRKPFNLSALADELKSPFPARSANREWLVTFWAFVQTRNGEDISQYSFSGLPLIPVCNQKGTCLKTLDHRSNLSCVSTLSKPFAKLVSYLDIDYLDTSFPLSGYIARALNLGGTSVSQVVKSAAANLPIFDNFTSDEKDDIRMSILGDTRSNLGDTLRKLPIFKVYHCPTSVQPKGGMIRGNIVGINYSVPRGVPITMACSGFAIEPVQKVFYREHTNRGEETYVVELSSEQFVSSCFLPHLGKLNITDEIENWKYVSQPVSFDFNGQALRNFSVPTSLTLAAISSDRDGEILPDQIPSSSRSNRYYIPDSSNPLHGTLTQLHECFASHGKMSISPLPKQLYHVSRGIAKVKPPESRAIVQAEILNIYLALVKTEDGKKWLCQQLVSEEQVEFDQTHVLTIISTSLALGLSRSVDITNFLIYSCASFADEATGSLRMSIPDYVQPIFGRFCPKIRDVPFTPFAGSIVGVYPISKCARYSARWLCWTQVPILHPLLEDISEALSPSISHVIAHIRQVAQMHRDLPAAVFVATLNACYSFLMHNASQVDPSECICALPVNENGDVICVPIDAIYDLSEVSIPKRCKVPLAPYIYTLQDDFPNCDALSMMVKKVKAPKLPTPTMILRVMNFVTNTVVQAKQTEHKVNFLTLQFEELLLVMSVSCSSYRQTCEAITAITGQVIGHIKQLVTVQFCLSLDEILTNLDACYSFLMKYASYVDPSECICALPVNEFCEVRCVPINVIYDLSEVTIPRRCKVPLAPYLYTLQDDFPNCDALSKMVKKVKAPKLPEPEIILLRMESVGNAIISMAAQAEHVDSNLNLQYEVLLRTMIASCSHNEYVTIWDYQEAEIFVPQQEQQDAVNMCMLPVPHWKGIKMLPAKEACAPDDKGLLDKLSPPARVTSLHFDMCKLLRITAASLRIREAPHTFDEFPSDIIATAVPTYINESRLATRVISAITMFKHVEAFNRFFTSNQWAEVMARVIATNNLRCDVPLEPETTLKILTSMKIVPVCNLTTHYIDAKFPNEIIQAQALLTNTTTPTHMVSVPDTSKRDVVVDIFALISSGLPIETVISREIKRLTGNTMVAVFPVSMVLSMIVKASTDHPDATYDSMSFDDALDYIGCIPADKIM